MSVRNAGMMCRQVQEQEQESRPEGQRFTATAAALAHHQVPGLGWMGGRLIPVERTHSQNA